MLSLTVAMVEHPMMILPLYCFAMFRAKCLAMRHPLCIDRANLSLHSPERFLSVSLAMSVPVRSNPPYEQNSPIHLEEHDGESMRCAATAPGTDLSTEHRCRRRRTSYPRWALLVQAYVSQDRRHRSNIHQGATNCSDSSMASSSCRPLSSFHKSSDEFGKTLDFPFGMGLAAVIIPGKSRETMVARHYRRERTYLARVAALVVHE